MTGWGLPHGMGSVKPDVVIYADRLGGSAIVSGCTRTSGTSVAAPVVAGAVALLASTIPQAQRKRLLNAGVLKAAIINGAKQLRAPDKHVRYLRLPAPLRLYALLPHSTHRAPAFSLSLSLPSFSTIFQHQTASVFEQGAGMVDLIAAHASLQAVVKRDAATQAALAAHSGAGPAPVAPDDFFSLTTMPSTLDLTDCPYMWPWCVSFARVTFLYALRCACLLIHPFPSPPSPPSLPTATVYRCAQPIYADAMPLIVNVSVLHSLEVYSEFISVEWAPSATEHGAALSVGATTSSALWPHVGYVRMPFFFTSLTPHTQSHTLSFSLSLSLSLFLPLVQLCCGARHGKGRSVPRRCKG